MPAAPQNPLTASTARDVTKFRTWLGRDAGQDPREEDEDPTFVPLKIMRTAGGRQLDYCELAVDLGRREERLVDIRTPTKWNRQVTIRKLSAETPDLDGDGAPIDNSDPAFWGFLGTQTISLRAPNDESATVTARLDNFLFGVPLTGMRVRDPRTDTVVVLERDPFFNPLVNGVIWANRSTHRNTVGDYVLWVHPESVKTVPAETYQGETSRGAWTLIDMVHSVCGLLNGNELFIKNPTRDELVASIVDAPEVENFYLKRGLWLPQALDAILEPHGFGWFTKISRGDSGAIVRKISVFKRGVGEEKEIFLQRPDDTTPPALDTALTNVAELVHELSVADLANKIEGYGGYQGREITLELYRGWLESEDSLTADELDKTETADNGSLYLTHPDAWRLWVANEAGDWTGYRPEIPNPRDLSGVFSRFVARRRWMDDCCQRDVNDRRIPPVAHWYDPAPPSGGAAEWRVIPPGSYSVLTDQIGIRFNGAKPPDDIVSAGANVKIRLTGTVSGDSRLFKEATRRDESPNGRNVTLVLDLSDRFFDRSVQTTGTYASAINDDAIYQPEDIDDGDDLQEYVNAVRNTEDAANIRAGITLAGIHDEYEIGNLITKVNGRNISFNRLSDDTEETRYLQVVGIEHDTQRQLTVLRVELNRDEGYERDGSFGGPFGKKFRNKDK